jgi:hypothetical protein
MIEVLLLQYLPAMLGYNLCAVHVTAMFAAFPVLPSETVSEAYPYESVAVIRESMNIHIRVRVV